MPMFDFVCKSCGLKLEDKIVGVGRALTCTVCGDTMTKEVGKTSFELKGKGWCKDGYK